MFVPFKIVCNLVLCQNTQSGMVAAAQPITMQVKWNATRLDFQGQMNGSLQIPEEAGQWIENFPLEH